MDKIRLCIVDDQILFRQGIASIIESAEQFQLLFEAGSGPEMLQLLKETKEQPLIALIDIEMPGMDGMELNAALQRLYPQLKVIILSAHSSPRLIARAIHAGACGYLLKNCDKEELIGAIESTYATGFYINARALKAIQEVSLRTPVYKNESGIVIDLSPREREVLQMICQELTNTEIAEKLFVSPRTIDGHRNNLLAKTGCRNTAGLVLFAIKHHIFEVPF